MRGLAHANAVAGPFHAADDADLDARLRPLVEQLHHGRIADLEIVQAQLPARALDERGERRPRVLGAHHEVRSRRNIGLPARIGGEQPESVGHGAPVLRGDREAPALVDVELREVEAEHVQDVVGDHVLGVIPGQVVPGARHRDARGEQALFELAKRALPAAVGVRDHRRHRDATLNRIGQRLLDLVAIEPEDAHRHRRAGPADGPDDGNDARFGLNRSAARISPPRCPSPSARSIRPHLCHPAPALSARWIRDRCEGPAAPSRRRTPPRARRRAARTWP